MNQGCQLSCNNAHLHNCQPCRISFIIILCFCISYRETFCEKYFVHLARWTYSVPSRTASTSPETCGPYWRASETHPRRSVDSSTKFVVWDVFSKNAARCLIAAQRCERSSTRCSRMLSKPSGGFNYLSHGIRRRSLHLESCLLVLPSESIRMKRNFKPFLEIFSITS